MQQQKKPIIIMTPMQFWQLVPVTIKAIIAGLFAFPFDLHRLFFQSKKQVGYGYSHVEIDLEHTLNTY